MNAVQFWRTSVLSAPARVLAVRSIRQPSFQGSLLKQGINSFPRLFNSTSVAFADGLKKSENQTPIIKKASSSRFLNTTIPVSSDNSTPEEDSKPRSVLRSIFHGVQDPQLREEEKQAHSKLLARGKYVHEFQKHKIKPEYVDEYIKLISEHYPRVANDPINSVHLCGSWQTQIGDLDSFVHIWEYNGYTGYEETQKQLGNDPHYQRFLKAIRPMIQNRTSQICLEFAFWATSPPAVHEGIYELRTYALQPGHLQEWQNFWKKGLECRRKFCEPVGAWFSQLGALNTIHHMWNYPNLEKRKSTREQAWEVDGWAETVYHTVRLVQEMKAAILVPLPFSPLR